MAVEGKLPAVPETILKRRKRQAENRALRAKDAVKQKVGSKTRFWSGFHHLLPGRP